MIYWSFSDPTISIIRNLRPVSIVFFCWCLSRRGGGASTPKYKETQFHYPPHGWFPPKISGGDRFQLKLFRPCVRLIILYYFYNPYGCNFSLQCGWSGFMGDSPVPCSSNTTASCPWYAPLYSTTGAFRWWSLREGTIFSEGTKYKSCYHLTFVLIPPTEDWITWYTFLFGGLVPVEKKQKHNIGGVLCWNNSSISSNIILCFVLIPHSFVQHQIFLREGVRLCRFASTRCGSYIFGTNNQPTTDQLFLFFAQPSSWKYLPNKVISVRYQRIRKMPGGANFVQGWFFTKSKIIKISWCGYLMLKFPGAPRLALPLGNHEFSSKIGYFSALHAGLWDANCAYFLAF